MSQATINKIAKRLDKRKNRDTDRTLVRKSIGIERTRTAFSAQRREELRKSIWREGLS